MFDLRAMAKFSEQIQSFLGTAGFWFKPYLAYGGIKKTNIQASCFVKAISHKSEICVKLRGVIFLTCQKATAQIGYYCNSFTQIISQMR